MPRHAFAAFALLAACAVEPVELDTTVPEPETDENGFPVFEAPPVPENGVQIHLEPFWLKPGKEKERCWTVKAGNVGPQYVKKMEIIARPGLHHSILIRTDARLDDGDEKCFGFPLSLLDDLTNLPEPMFATSTQVYEEVVSFPDGVGYQIQGNQQVVLNYHYLNAGTEEIPAEIWVNLTFAEPGEVTQPAQSFFVGNIGGIDMPPHTAQTVTTTCDLPSASMVTLTPHLHQRGVDFKAWRQGDASQEFLYEEEGWFDPTTAVFAPAVPFAGADQLSFTCSWVNDTDTHVRFGETSNDEMCFVFGHIYPAYNPVYAFEDLGCDETHNEVTPL